MNNKNQLSNLQMTRKTFPWVTFCFLAVIFFIIQHDLFFLLKKDLISPDIVIKARIEGSLDRKIAFLTLGFFGVVSLMRQKKNNLKINGFFGFLILFYFVWAFSSLAWAQDTTLTFRRLVAFAMLCLGAIAVSKRFSISDIILFTLLSTGFYLIIGLSAEIAFGTFQPFAPEYRFSGTLHPNYQSVNCALLLISAIFFSRYANGASSLYLLVEVAALTFLVLTKSRTALVSTLLALSAVWALGSTIRRKAFIFLCISWTICFLYLVFGDISVQALFKGILLGRHENPFMLTGRIPLWKECFEYIAQRPFLGYGYHSFDTPGRLLELQTTLGWSATHAHSEFIELLIDLGIVGMITYYLIMAFAIRRSIKYYKIFDKSAYGFCIAILIFCISRGALEATVMIPSLFTFLTMYVLAHLGFVIFPLPNSKH